MLASEHQETGEEDLFHLPLPRQARRKRHSLTATISARRERHSLAAHIQAAADSLCVWLPLSLTDPVLLRLLQHLAHSEPELKRAVNFQPLDWFTSSED